jgi:hypothetical protein
VGAGGPDGRGALGPPTDLAISDEPAILSRATATSTGWVSVRFSGHWRRSGRNPGRNCRPAGQFGLVNTGAPPHGLTDAKFDDAITHDLQIDQVIGWAR